MKNYLGSIWMIISKTLFDSFLLFHFFHLRPNSLLLIKTTESTTLNNMVVFYNTVIWQKKVIITMSIAQRKKRRLSAPGIPGIKKFCRHSLRIKILLPSPLEPCKNMLSFHWLFMSVFLTRSWTLEGSFLFHPAFISMPEAS